MSTKLIRLLGGLAIALAAGACSDTLQPPVVGSVEIIAPQRNLLVGDTLTLRARALAAGGETIEGRPAVWSTTDAQIVEVTTAGRARALRPGRATLRVVIDGKAADVELAVSTVPAASLTVAPEQLILPEGTSEVAIAIARDAAGDPLNDRPATWHSEDTLTANVDASGRITARRRGTANVIAEVDGRTATVAVTVVPAAVALIEIAPGAAVLAVGGTRQYTARITDAAGNVLADRTVLWTTDAPAVAAISASGVLSATGPGYVTVTAAVEGRSASVAATVVQSEEDAMPFDLIYHRTMPGTVGEIMMLGTAGLTAPIRLNAGNVSRQPAPSPDGNRVAFYVSMQELGTGAQVDDIFAVDRNGMNMKRLTDDAGVDDQPAWSPDGLRIAYRHMDAQTGRTSIRVMNADGSGKANLTADMELSHWVSEPAWSADGSTIAFGAIAVVTPPAVHGIWTMNADGSNKQQRTSSTGFDSSPTWSPDGSRIAFIRNYSGDPDITTVSLATGAIARMQLPGQQRSPAWSPDGRHIAFWQPIGTSGATAIYTVRADGTNMRLHTLDPVWGGGYDPQWLRR